MPASRDSHDETDPANPVTTGTPLTMAPSARPGRSRTLIKLGDKGVHKFGLVPYRVGDRVRATAVSNDSIFVEGNVTEYDGESVIIDVEEVNGRGKFDDWLIEIVTSAIPAPPSPEETESAVVAAIAPLDQTGGQVVGDFARKVLELTRDMDDKRDLCHYIKGFAIAFNEDVFTCELAIDEKNCDISSEERAALQAEANLIRQHGLRQTPRHLDLEHKRVRGSDPAAAETH